LAAGALVASAQAPQNWIYQHNSAYWLDPNDPNLPDPNYYEVNQQDHTVVIHHGIPTETFWFDAVVRNPEGDLYGAGNIHSIAVDPNAGTVAVKIEGSGHEYGAENVDAISLRSLAIQDAAGGSRSRGLRPAHPSGACGGCHATTGASTVSDRGNQPGCGRRPEVL
jgi:hypothetical protein